MKIVKLSLYALCLTLCAEVFSSCNTDTFTEYAAFDQQPSTEWGRRFAEGANSHVAMVKSDKFYSVTDGVNVLEMAYLTETGLAMKLFMFEINLSDHITLRTTMAKDENKTGTGQILEKQLEAMAKNHPDWTIVGGTNADFFNTTTNVPYGVIWREGECVKSTFELPAANSPHVANVVVVDKTNKVWCMSKEDYEAFDHSTISETVNGRSTLLFKEGQAQNQTGSSMYSNGGFEPRTMLGVTADRKTVYIFVVDGRDFFYSNGASLNDLCELMGVCNVYEAVNLDGGGSSTFIIRDPETSEFSLLNHCTDGSQRKMPSGLAIVKH